MRSLSPDGVIELQDGGVLDASYREFVPGYALTSYGSQGKTVDYVLFSDSTIKAATNDQQWYVTISRGRKGIRIFTPDKEQLRENVIRSGQRKLALEIAGSVIQQINRRDSPTQGMEGWLRRFGRRAARLICAARQFHHFHDHRKETYEHKISRVLVR